MSASRDHLRDEANEPSRELRARLDGWNPPAARAEFRASLREQFLAASSVARTESESVSVEDRLSEWVVPAARPEFRQQLREQVLAAAKPRTAALKATDGARPARTETEEKQRVDSRAQRPTRRHSSAIALTGHAPSEVPRSAPKPAFGAKHWAGLLAAAAAVVLLFVIAPWKQSAAGPWRAVDYVDDAHFVVDGAKTPYSNSELLSKSFEQGDCHVFVGAADLRVLALDEGVLLEFPSQTDVRILPRQSGEKGVLELELASGAVSVSTNAKFHGRILVRTPDAVIELSGRSVGIHALPNGTCLCVLNGKALMTGVDNHPEPTNLASGESVFVLRAEKEVMRKEELFHVKELESFSGTSTKYLF